MTLIELLFFASCFAAGVLTATCAYPAWGGWGAFWGFVLGALSFMGALQAASSLFAPTRARCPCGKCGVDDYVIRRDAAGQPVLHAYACGRVFRLGDDRRLHPIEQDPRGESPGSPRDGQRPVDDAAPREA